MIRTENEGYSRSRHAGPASERPLVAERVPTSFLGVLADLVKWLESAQISAMVIGVDVEEIRQHASDFAAATSMSDLIEDFEQLLRRRKSKQLAACPRPK
jgi:hypothetical protein